MPITAASLLKCTFESRPGWGGRYFVVVVVVVVLSLGIGWAATIRPPYPVTMT